MFCLCALRCSWAVSTDGAYPSSAARGAVIRRSAERLARRRKRRLSTHESYRGAKQRGECGADLPRSDSEGPLAGSLPLRGRQAELFKCQSTRSEPRRIDLFTGHRRSCLSERVRKTPAEAGRPNGTAPSKGVQKRRVWRAFGYFSRVGKVPSWHKCHRDSCSASPNGGPAGSGGA